jgi:hypothetical protein
MMMSDEQEAYYACWQAEQEANKFYKQAEDATSHVQKLEEQLDTAKDLLLELLGVINRVLESNTWDKLPSQVYTVPSKVHKFLEGK